jgi:glycosyltransferase involved in cell wall biosynthesis
MKASIIITTYNSEEWLLKVLLGYTIQSNNDFEIIIADDGSTPKTKKLLESFKSSFKYSIVHVWQEDIGFRKSKILNEAIKAASSEYLIFTDGDCIPRRDFVEKHLLFKEKGYFLSGGYFKLPLVISNLITDETIINQDCFSYKWLLKNKLKLNFKLTKLTNNVLFSGFMNWITTTKKTFNGHNSSVFKEDLLKINGFNENMHYGGLDREVGERLFNLGILSKQIRYSAICLHLHHERGYANKSKIQENLAIRKKNIKNKIVWINEGIFKTNNNS